MRIAVLGMGHMGQAIATRLLDQGHTVVVWNRTADKARQLAEQGALPVEGLAEAVGDVAVAITSLSNDDAVRSLALGDDGILATGTEALYVDASTISPGLSHEIAQRYPPFVSMPISGSPDAVRAGHAVYLVGGPDGSVEVLEPVLADLSSTRRRYPESRLAAVAKLTVNAVLLAGIVALAEGLAVGDAGGLDEDQLRELLSESPTVAPGVRGRFEAILTGSGPTLWSVDLGSKDARLALEIGTPAHQLPVITAAKGSYDTASDQGHGDDDVAAVARIYLG